MKRRALVSGAAALAAMARLEQGLAFPPTTGLGWRGMPGPPGGDSPIAPSQAVSAGLTTLTFNDDFTSNMVATSSGQTSGANWYWATFAGGSSSNWNVQTTSTAAIVGAANGAAAPPAPSWNSGNPSPNGGVFSINTGVQPNASVFSVPNNITTLPSQGVYAAPFYVEFYTQCVANGPSSTQSEGWPALWSWSFENGSTIGQPSFGSTNPSLTPTEIDFFETYGHIFGAFPDPDYGFGVHYPAGGTGTGSVNFPATPDNNWHTYGCLVGTTTLSVYVDNVLVGTVSVSSACPDLTSEHQFLIMGTGTNWQLNTDWVRVWT